MNGDPKSALAVIASPLIGEKRFVSKNVCHGVVYDADLHARFAAVKHHSKSLALIRDPHWPFSRYSSTSAHSPIDGSIAQLAPGSGVHIIVGHDRERFADTLTAHGK